MRIIDNKLDLIAESLSSRDPAVLFRPVQDYARLPLPEAFYDMPATLEQLFSSYKKVNKFDATAFYSRRRQNLSDEEEESLAVFNQAAFTAAESMGGLIVYYQGHILKKSKFCYFSVAKELGFVPDCMSFCIWQTRKQAKKGASVAPHKKAVARTHVWYENFGVKKYEINATDRNKITFREFERN